MEEVRNLFLKLTVFLLSTESLLAALRETPDTADPTKKDQVRKSLKKNINIYILLITKYIVNFEMYSVSNFMVTTI